MRQPAIKLPISYKIYPQNTPKIFYRPTRLIYILDPYSISPTTPVKTLLIRNSSSML